MPLNLPPEALEAQHRHRDAETLEEKISTLEEYISAIPKHKGTDHLRADLRRKLSKLKNAAQTQKRTGKQVSVYHIESEGVGQVVLVGVANVGKSALVAALTNATPEVAAYPFTTWTPTPGMMEMENVQIQLIDTPPLNEDFIEPEMLNLVRRADLVLLVIDLQGYPLQELEDTVAILREHRIIPSYLQEDSAGERRPTVVPALVLANKCDDEACAEDFIVLCELLDHDWPLLPVSATTGRNLEHMKRVVYDRLGMIRVYAKPPGREPDYSAPFVMREGGTVEEFASKVHQDFAKNLKSARVWGSATHDGQMVGRDHVLHEGDVVELRI
ncbi:MAG: TGS domain-containing protein [Anaerolineae bacterium]|jgi:small GTP-binding protein